MGKAWNKLTTSFSLLHQNASDIVPLNKRPNTLLRWKNRIYFNNSIRSKYKEITLARGLTSLQNKQEINVNRTCK